MKEIKKRKEYTLGGLEEPDIPEIPSDLFDKWFLEASAANIIEPNAMALATCANSGAPSVRFVLAKGFSEEGICFYTNYESRKGLELEQNPKASVAFYWDVLERQVRIEGVVEKTTAELSDNYFNNRPFEAQLGAIVSKQSEVLTSREVIEEEFAKKKIELDNIKLERPDNWGGYILKPNVFEFWQGRIGRLHDRIRYQLVGGNWEIARLYP